MGLFSLFKKSDTVYLPDSMTFFKHKEGYELYLKIFSKLGIAVRVLDKPIMSGREAFEAGYEQTARKIAKENLILLKEQDIKKIITTSPECYNMLLKHYPELIPDWEIETENIWKILCEKLEENHSFIINKAIERVTFHDNCALGRYCKIYDEPRKILNIIGYEIQEMDNTKENSLCCGSCGGLPIIDKELANNLAKERILQAKRIGVKKMIVTSFDNYHLLTKNSQKTGIEIYELSEVLGIALGIEKKEYFKEENIVGEEQVLEKEDNKSLQEVEFFEDKL